MFENIVYFDTNILSNIAKSLSLEEIANLRNSFLVRDERPVISAINILEILSTQDEELREKIILACQYLCDNKMLAEPEALIVDYIVTKEKKSNTNHLYKENQYSTSQLANTWKEVQEDKRKTLKITNESLAIIHNFKLFAGFLHAYYSRGNRLPDLEKQLPNKEYDYIQQILEKTRNIRQTPVPSSRVAVLCENRTLVKLLILCAGISPFPDAIEEYWNSIGINNVTGRYSYVSNELQFLDDEGPIIGLGSYMGWQATKGHDNGNFFDCLHFLYLPYVKSFFTDDKNFHNFMKDYPKAGILQRILPSSEIEYFSQRNVTLGLVETRL